MVDMPVKERVRSGAVGAEVTGIWGSEKVPHTIILTPRNWQRVKSGKLLTIRGKGYSYDGEWYSAC